MSEFLNAILAFPTVVYTILLGVVVVYWLFVLLGALDIDLLGDADLDGHGHADLHLDGHGHLDGHAHLDGHLDGHGHHHGDHHGDTDADSPGGLAGLIQSLGLGGVPVTLMLSVLILAGWGFCLGAAQLLGASSAWVAIAAPLVALGLAVPVTAMVIRPLRRFFVSLEAPRHRDFLGKVCTITTLRVDERYGQAEVEDGGAGLIVQVRSTEPDRLNRGDRALIFDYKDEVFYVAPMDEALRRNLDNMGS